MDTPDATLTLEAPYIDGEPYDDNGFYITWEPVPGADSYLLESGEDDEPWQALAYLPPSDPWFAEEEPEAGVTRRYRVAALRGGVIASPWSETFYIDGVD